MIDKATLMASIAAAAGQAVGGDRAPAPSANKGVQADAFRPPANSGEAKALSSVRQTLEEEAAAGVLPAPKASDLWRSRFDAETLKMFTEVLDPITRDAVYRIPPGRISEEAEREGEQLARQERLERDLALVV
jgi:hypothetical protein